MKVGLPTHYLLFMVDLSGMETGSALHSAFAAALSRVCQAINWDYGEAWMLNPEKTLLELSPAWFVYQNHSEARLDALAQFRACSEDFILSIDEGLPGKIWRSHQPQWINDVSVPSEAYFLRDQIAKAFNIKAGFGFPVFRHQAVIAIFVFFSDQACEADQHVIQRAIAAAAPIENESFYVV